MSTSAGYDRPAWRTQSVFRLPPWRAAVAFFGALVLTVGLALAPDSAAANSKFSAITIDAHTGKVLFSRYADSRRYPASLTKVMTLYILFQEMEAGRFSKSSRIRISRHAASMPPSKLGFKPGQTITVDNAIRALVTKSANDVAAAVGEAIAGTESAFAVRMTKTARSLGMTRTTFRNASGLPNSGQVTTARDMATLGLRIQKDFPELYRYFSLTSFSYKGRNYRNHNKLVGRYKGTDGIKTGYIRASGFNLLASVKRNGKHLIGVVTGGRTGRSRNNYMMSMLDKVFPRVPSRKTLNIASVAGTPPGYNPTKVKAARRAVARVLNPPLPTPKPVIVAADTAGEPVKADVMSVLAAGDREETSAEAGGAIPDESRIKLVAMAAAEEGDAGDTPAILASADGMARGETWHIQVGAFDSESGAEEYLRKVLATGLTSLDDKPAFIIPFERGAAMFYRARLSGFDKKTAQTTCKSLAKRSFACFAVAPPAVN